MTRNFVTPFIFGALVTLGCTAGMFADQAQAQMSQPAAASPVTLRSDVKIERTERDANGIAKTVLLTPKDIAVVPGDNVIFTLYVNNSGSEPVVGFKAINPMPAAVNFASVWEDWAELSVDGGKVWGKLADLKVKTKNPDGTAISERAATPADVTHVRWVFAEAIAPGAEGILSYRGVVK